MKNQIQQWKTLLKSKTLAALFMLALTACFGSYEFLKPASASAASVAPAAAALDDSSISALTALDHGNSSGPRNTGGCERDCDFARQAAADIGS
jgi:hypothetical protein